jgi:hypothetical protein
MRSRIVKNIMADVPEVDYDLKIKQKLNDLAYDEAPAEIKAMRGTPLWGYVRVGEIYVRSEGYFHVAAYASSGRGEISLGHPWYDALSSAGLIGARLRQRDQRAKMCSDLTAMMSASRTVADLRKSCPPELLKYMPEADGNQVQNLPAKAIVDSLKKMGMQP